MTPSPVVHFEIGASDVVGARDFYAQLFGWSVQVDAFGYGLVDTGSPEGIGGGIMPAPPGRPGWVTFYVEVDDLATRLARAEELGGRVIMGPTPIPGRGAFAMIADPEGSIVGLFTPSSPAT